MDSFFDYKTSRNNKEKQDPYTEETWELIVKRILYLTKVRRININTVAMRAGITPSTLKSILYGSSKNPGIVTLRKICDGLEISLEDFFHAKLFREWM